MERVHVRYCSERQIIAKMELQSCDRYDPEGYEGNKTEERHAQVAVESFAGMATALPTG